MTLTGQAASGRGPADAAERPGESSPYLVGARVVHGGGGGGARRPGPPGSLPPPEGHWPRRPPHSSGPDLRNGGGRAASSPQRQPNSHRAPPRPRRRPAHDRARSRIGRQGAGAGVRPRACCVRAGVRACGKADAAQTPRVELPSWWLPTSPRRMLGSGVLRLVVGFTPCGERARAEPRACACAYVRACAAALWNRHHEAQARLWLPCSVSFGKRWRRFGSAVGTGHARPPPGHHQLHVCPIPAPWLRLLPCCPHLTEEDTKGQKSPITCPKSLRGRTAIKSNSLLKIHDYENNRGSVH